MKEIFSRLREQAEQSIDMADIDVSTLSELDIKNIIHNLDVHRIELEMQNEELQRANKELEDAKHQYGDLFEFAPVGYLTLDRQYRITQVNLTFLQLIGVSKERIITAPFTDFICPDFQDDFYLTLGRLRKTGEKQQLDLQLLHGDHRPLWVHIEMSSRDSGQSYLMSISDVTRQKQSEQALKASETKFRDLFDVVVDPMFIHDMTGNILEVNESACRKLGYSRRQLVGMNVIDIDTQTSKTHITSTIAELMRKGEILFEGIHKTFSHRQFPVEIHSKIIEFEGKKAILSLARDISRRKEAEQRYELLSNVTFEGIFIHQNGIAIDVNASCCRLTGYTRDELIGKNLFTLIATPEDQARARQKMILSEVAPYDIRVRRKDGSVFDAELEARNIEHQGEHVRIVAIRDVTERKKSELAIKASEEKFRALFNNVNDAIGLHKVTRTGISDFLEVNERACKMFGFSKEEFLNMSPADIVDEHIVADFPNLLEKLIFEGRLNFEAEHKTKSGARMPVDINALVFEMNGEKYISTVTRDITERKQAEEALRESEEKNQRLADATFEAIFFSEQAICTNQNNTAERMFGYTLHEAIGKPAKEWIHPEYRELVKQNMIAHVADPYEAVALRKDGSTFPCEIQAKTAFHGDKKVRITALRDITDRKQAEEALRESEAKFRSIIENVNDIIYAVTPEGTFTYISPNWPEMLGHEVDEVLGKNFAHFVHPQDAHLCAEFLEKVLHTGEKQSGVEYRVKHKDGTWRWHFSNGSPLKNAENITVSYIGVARDVTERKHAEEAIKEALAEKEVLLKEIHHRVKNNMQTIASLLYKQQQYTDDVQVRNILDDSIQRVKSMALIHEQIYRSEENLARINLAEYIRHFANKLFKTYRPKERAISLTIRVEQIYLPVDKSIPVALILNELIMNALKYAFPDQRDGEIGVECSAKNQEVTLIVRDNGVGLPENFDPQQTNTLGIYLVYNLATKQLGGTIAIHHQAPTEFAIKFKAMDN